MCQIKTCNAYALPTSLSRKSSKNVKCYKCLSVGLSPTAHFVDTSHFALNAWPSPKSWTDTHVHAAVIDLPT